MLKLSAKFRKKGRNGHRRMAEGEAGVGQQFTLTRGSLTFKATNSDILLYTTTYSTLIMRK